MVETIHSCPLSSSAQETLIKKIAQMLSFGHFFLQNAIYFHFYLVILHPISKNSYFLWYIISLKGSVLR